MMNKGPKYISDTLPDDNLDKVTDQFAVFVGLLEERYRYTCEHAEDKSEKQLKEYEIGLKKKGYLAL